MGAREDLSFMLIESIEELDLLQGELQGIGTNAAQWCKTVQDLITHLRRAQASLRSSGIAETKAAIREALIILKARLEIHQTSKLDIRLNAVQTQLVRLHFDLRDYLIPDALKLKGYSTRP